MSGPKAELDIGADTDKRTWTRISDVFDIPRRSRAGIATSHFVSIADSKKAQRCSAVGPSDRGIKAGSGESPAVQLSTKLVCEAVFRHSLILRQPSQQQEQGAGSAEPSRSIPCTRCNTRVRLCRATSALTRGGWKLQARAGHQLESCVPELPARAGDADGTWSEPGWMHGDAARRERAVTPKRGAVWPLAEPDICWGPQWARRASRVESAILRGRLALCALIMCTRRSVLTRRTAADRRRVAQIFEPGPCGFVA